MGLSLSNYLHARVLDGGIFFKIPCIQRGIFGFLAERAAV